MNDSARESRQLNQALRWSGIALLVLIALGAVVFFLVTRESTVSESEEKAVAIPLLIRSETQPPDFKFTDVTASSGIDFVHINGAQGERYLPETMGGGVAFLDFDLDRDLDLLFVNSKSWSTTESTTPTEKSALYENDGNGQFKNVSSSHFDVLGYGMGPAVGDINGDGYPDLFIANLGKNQLFLNQEGERFVEVTDEYGVAGTSDAFSTCASFFDYDRDGDLDLFVCNYVDWSKETDHEIDFRLTGVGRAYGPPTDFPGTESWLYRNDGEQFTDVTSEAGLIVVQDQTQLPVGKALAVGIADVNNDRAPDIIVANDTVRNFVFVNQSDGTFEEHGIAYGLAFDPSGAATGAMGLDTALFGNDERLGIAIGNFANEMTSFYVGDPAQGVFSDNAIVVGIGASTRKVLTFGVFFFDADLDGRLDLLTINGHIEPEISRVQASQQYKQPPQLFWNCGGACRRDFVLVEQSSGDLHKTGVGRGAAYGDIDNDGDLDVVITNVGGVPHLLRNDTPQDANWLQISLRFTSPNLYGIGSRIQLRTNTGMQTRTMTRTRSYLTQVDASVHFGLGEEGTVVEILVEWPNGIKEAFREDTTHGRIELTFGQGERMDTALRDLNEPPAK